MSSYPRTDEGFARALNEVATFRTWHPKRIVWLYRDVKTDMYGVTVITPSIGNVAKDSGLSAYRGDKETCTPKGVDADDTILYVNTIIAALMDENVPSGWITIDKI